MSTDYKPQLPEIFPTGKIRVSDETHTYRTFENSDGSIYEEREYTLEKAPIDEIFEVTGTVDNQTYTFSNGSDYELSADSERIIWLDDPATRPDAGTTFDISYQCDSILSRYMDSSAEEMQTADDKILTAISSKFVDSATGKELDRLGKMFGVLGKRRGRNDTQYRIYLKSVVQSFVSRGTVNGIKVAISVATDVPVEDITIDENFDTNEYEVVVLPNTPVKASTLERIAEIADPSGINQLLTRFTLDEDSIGINDALTIRENSDAATIDGMFVDDSIFINQNKTSIAVDSVAVSDTALVNTDKTTVSDQISSDDAVTTSQTEVAWGADWGSMHWAVDHD